MKIRITWKKQLLLLLMILALVPAVNLRAGAAGTKSSYEVLSGGHWKRKKVNGKIKYRYKKADGTYAGSGWKKVDGGWFNLDKNGCTRIGLTKIDGKYFFFRKSGGSGVTGKMATGLRTVGRKKCFFRKKGGVGIKGSRVESEWVDIDGEEYYFKQNGAMHPEKKLTEEEFIQRIGPMARADMKETGILASVTIAQAILESGYGSTSLAIEANNFFGMKASLSGNTWKSEWGGDTFKKKTLEWYGRGFVTVTADFRAYPDMAASIRDHSNYLRYAKSGYSLRYSGVVGNKSYKKTIELIKNGGYATDPEYVSKICNIIKRFGLTKYDK